MSSLLEILIPEHVRRPKARIAENAWGNWSGYIGKKKVIEFANMPQYSPEQAARKWLEEYNRFPWQ